MKPLDGKFLKQLLDSFAGKRLLVVGDLHLYEYIWGRMAEISTEGPVPVVHVHSRSYAPGSGGNIAAGLAALGAKAAICGCIGDDPAGKTLAAALEEQGVDTSPLITLPRTATNTQTKISAGGHHSATQEVLRTHTIPPKAVGPETESRIIAAIDERICEIDGLILSDQTGSVLTRAVIDHVIELRKKHDVIVVGDSRENVRDLRGIDLVVPNDYEAGLAINLAVENTASIERAGEMLLGCQKLQNVIITRGRDGMSVFSRHHPPVHLQTFALDVFDITGAGDTVTAVSTLALTTGASAVEAAQVANLAAGVAVSRIGTVTVTAQDILDAHARYFGTAPSAKIKTLDELRKIIAGRRAEGCSIAWTNGCFDILHTGHLSYLRMASRQADVLIVGVSGDECVRKLKGPDRPINSQTARAELLAEMACIDYVIIFEEESPAAILEDLKPDVYIKGGDYTIDTINQTERRVMESFGGRISLLGHVEGESTTGIIEKILRKNKGI